MILKEVMPNAYHINNLINFMFQSNLNQGRFPLKLSTYERND